MSEVQIAYGTQGLTLEAGEFPVKVLRPNYPPPIADEGKAFRDATRAPLGGGLPLKERIHWGEKLACVIPDITRALPNERLLGWLFQELEHIPAGDITIISGTGTHRANTKDEWKRMVGERIFKTYRCIDHVCDDPDKLQAVGDSSFGYPVKYNKEYVEADRRIILGFIEPHFMAGFSGGYKAVLPGLADIDAIMHYHSAKQIAHPSSTWGIIEGNPTQDHIRAGGSILPVDFCINVTQDDEARITGFFCGDVIAAHEAGCAFCKETAMVACDRTYPVVVTSNSGYPLDQNLYQCVKGMSAASQIVELGGTIVMAGQCNDGLPDHGNFQKILTDHENPEAMLEAILGPGFHCRDQWQVQILANVLMKAKVGVFSELPDDVIKGAHMVPVSDINEAIRNALRSSPADTPVAILPEGPMVIPYIC